MNRPGGSVADAEGPFTFTWNHEPEEVIGYWTGGSPCPECRPPNMPRKAPGNLIWRCPAGHEWTWHRNGEVDGLENGRAYHFTARMAKVRKVKRRG